MISSMRGMTQRHHEPHILTIESSGTLAHTKRKKEETIEKSLTNAVIA